MAKSHLPDLFQEYRRLRKQYPTMEARHALSTIRREQEHKNPPLEWIDPNDEGSHRVYRSSNIIKKATVEIEDFRCHVTVQYDHDHDWSDSRGTFTDTWEPSAIVIPGARSPYNSPGKYFVPENTEEEHRKWFEEHGYARGVAAEMARAYVMEDLRIALSPDEAGYIVVGVEATAFFRDTELGSSGCWGIEIKSEDDAYVEEVAWEEIHEALAAARKKLAKLREP